MSKPRRLRHSSSDRQPAMERLEPDTPDLTQQSSPSRPYSAPHRKHRVQLSSTLQQSAATKAPKVDEDVFALTSVPSLPLRGLRKQSRQRGPFGSASSKDDLNDSEQAIDNFLTDDAMDVMYRKQLLEDLVAKTSARVALQEDLKSYVMELREHADINFPSDPEYNYMMELERGKQCIERMDRMLYDLEEKERGISGKKKSKGKEKIRKLDHDETQDGDSSFYSEPPMSPPSPTRSVASVFSCASSFLSTTTLPSITDFVRRNKRLAAVIAKKGHNVLLLPEEEQRVTAILEEEDDEESVGKDTGTGIDTYRSILSLDWSEEDERLVEIDHELAMLRKPNEKDVNGAAVEITDVEDLREKLNAVEEHLLELYKLHTEDSQARITEETLAQLIENAKREEEQE